MYLSDARRLRPSWWSSDPRARELERDAGTACTGVQMLERLTRLTPVQRQLLAQRKLTVIPQLFVLKRRIAEERKAGDARWQQHARELQDIVDKGFGAGYALTNEADELARARCELARAKVDAWAVLSPRAVAAKAARIPSTDEEVAQQRVEQAIKTKIPPPAPKRSFSQVFWTRVDDRIDRALGATKLSAAWRKRIKAAARAAIEKGASAALGRALDEAGVGGSTKKAVEGVVKELAKRPVE